MSPDWEILDLSDGYTEQYEQDEFHLKIKYKLFADAYNETENCLENYFLPTLESDDDFTQISEEVINSNEFASLSGKISQSYTTTDDGPRRRCISRSASFEQDLINDAVSTE